MEFSSCCPQAGCPGGKPRKTVFRGGFLRKSLEKLSNINYINWITGIEFHKLQILRFTSEIIVPFTNVKNLTFGGNPVKISCARYWWSVYLVIFSSFFASYDAINEHRGDQNVARKLLTVDRNDNFRRLPSPLRNRKLPLRNLKYTGARI